MATSRPFAVVTGGSSGIGLELAKLALENGYDVLIAADRGVAEAVSVLDGGDGQGADGRVETVEADLSTFDGVDRLYSAVAGRTVDLLCANAGHGLGHAFLDEQVADWRHVIDTNITGTVYLLHKVGNDMRATGAGRILITGSIAGLMPGSFQAVYNGTKAFVDSFAAALRDEMRDSGVTITCLMPGPTETEFFARAGMMDTKVGAGAKEDPAATAKHGWDALMDDKGQVVSGWKNKLQAAIAHVTPDPLLAKMHRDMAEPGTAVKA